MRNADAIATVHTDRATVIKALADPAAVDELEIAGDDDAVREVLRNLTTFGGQALIEP